MSGERITLDAEMRTVQREVQTIWTKMDAIHHEVIVEHSAGGGGR